jgi:hypothetical protein
MKYVASNEYSGLHFHTSSLKLSFTESSFLFKQFLQIQLG